MLAAFGLFRRRQKKYDPARPTPRSGFGQHQPLQRSGVGGMATIGKTIDAYFQDW